MIKITDLQKAREIAARIVTGWGLTGEQTDQLLGDSDPEHVSDVLRIYAALRTIFPSEDRAKAWPAKPNDYYAGKSALDVMLDDRISEVRKYLEGQCL
jgi:hypothetical protein